MQPCCIHNGAVMKPKAQATAAMRWKVRAAARISAVRHAAFLIRPNTNTTASWPKISYQINENHRIGASLNGQQGHNYTNEESYNLMASAWREADDVNRRRNANLFYEWTPQSGWLSTVKADIDYQRTKVSAVNYKGL